MTRSRKKAIVNISKPRTKEHRRRERRKVKEELRIKDDPDFLDSKEYGNDEAGTKCDLEYYNLNQLESDGWEEEQERLRRK